MIKPLELWTPQEIDNVQPPSSWNESKDPEWVKDWRGNIRIRQRWMIREAMKEGRAYCPESAKALKLI